MEPVLQFSESISKIAQALVIAQGNMTTVKKSSTNPHFNSKYADLEAVIDATRPALQAAGIVMMQATGGDGVTITIETMFIHAESGEWMRSTLGLKPTKADPQGAGSAITYGRRYSLLAMCGLAPEDDDGNGASKNPTAAKAAAKPSATDRKVAPIADGQKKDEHRERVLAMTLFSKLGYDAEQRYDFYEQTAGYDEAGEPLRSWEAVVKMGRAGKVLDALKKLVSELEDAGVIERRDGATR